MKFIMFTKHLQGLDVPDIIEALQSVGVQGADLCVRSGYPVNPENADDSVAFTAKQFATEGLSIPLITTPGDFLEPTDEETIRVYAAAGEAGVENIKLGYWHWRADDGGYWTRSISSAGNWPDSRNFRRNTGRAPASITILGHPWDSTPVR